MLSTVHYFQLTVAHHCLQNIWMGPVGKIPQCSKLIKSQSDDFLFGPTELEKVVRKVDESLDFPTVLVMSGENPAVNRPHFVDIVVPLDFTHQPSPQLRQVVVDVHAVPTCVLAQRPLASLACFTSCLLLCSSTQI